LTIRPFAAGLRLRSPPLPLSGGDVLKVRMSSRVQSITIHDVASEAGVSIKTVSRVLRDEPDVAEATRARVREVMTRLKYVPHPSARSLASTSCNVVGLVLAHGARSQPGVPGSGAFHEYRMRMQLGALDACERAGYGLRIERVGRQDPQAGAQLVDRVRRREVGGYVLASMSLSVPGLRDALDEAGICYVALAGYEVPGGAVAVSSDDRAAMRAITRLVLEAGHRRIGFVRADPGWRDAEDRYAGFLDAMAEAGQPVSHDLVFQGRFDYQSGREAAAHLLALPERPTAIVASSDDIAAGVISIAHERGLHLPAELSVTGYDDLDIAFKLWPPLTTVHRPIEKMVEIATRQLLDQLKPAKAGAKPALHHVQVHSEVVRRQSVVPPAVASDPVSSPVRSVRTRSA
jgi:LacI family transcriptional regulator